MGAPIMAPKPPYAWKRPGEAVALLDTLDGFSARIRSSVRTVPQSPIIRDRRRPPMHYGIVMFSTHYAIRPDELARAVEARGFESLWIPEHTHIPASRRSPWPGGPSLPKEYGQFHGQFVNFDKMWSFPKPAQRPHPPILMGGDGPTTFDRVLEYCEGWMPIAGRMGPGLSDKIATLQRRAKDAGRGPIPVTAFMVKPDRAAIDPLEAAGIDRAIFGVPSETADKVLPLLDTYAKLIR